MEITPIAYFSSPFTSKFGIPRQSGLLEDVEGEIVFVKPYDNPDAIRGIEGFTHLWLVWGFSATNTDSQAASHDTRTTADTPTTATDITANHAQQHTTHAPTESLLVRPPRLGGNERIGVFASRSPFRPNRLGLSSVRLEAIEQGRLRVRGADLMDGTPIYDIKPYITFTDSHPDATSGFVDDRQWNELDVRFPEHLQAPFSAAEIRTIKAALREDPRPQYHSDSDRVYGMPFSGHDIRFTVSNGTATVVEVR